MHKNVFVGFFLFSMRHDQTIRTFVYESMNQEICFLLLRSEPMQQVKMKQTYICFTSTYCTVCTSSESDKATIKNRVSSIF